MDSNYYTTKEASEGSLIDLVIPVYNGAALLKAREQELFELAEKNPDLRIFVVDDGSEDDFAGAVEALTRHQRVIAITLSENGGRAVARNAGAFAGSAPFICFVDVDCKPCEDWVRILRDAVRRGRQFVFGRVECIEQTFWSRYVNDVYRSREAGARHDGANMSSQIFMVRRYHFENCGGFFEGYRYYGFEDRDLFNRLVANEGLEPVLCKSLVVRHEPEIGPDAICRKMYIGGKYSAGVYAERFPTSYRQSDYWYFDFRQHGRVFVAGLAIMLCLYEPLLKLPADFYNSKLFPYVFRKYTAKLLFALCFARGTRDSSR
ncbi:glycosyltransferase family A protein [Marinobacter sp. TBZ242]|uniref:Glycosyltransferase family A protein n=1 Tax=Marinobacter azerbaijanicus TaxID=3050455 RepID=A0ABT7IE49_9GAMM|nr:glycosyltransferase family A protein [Marinobacter sp. TBZ242]MDL0432012.1 glycosyltransferase family A protein [Marinobacter sp. TBZ242]